ncbi:MAG TPA: hypothetical protein VKP88_08580 [Candidatus Paceibacterota bacterium]|nr:hypothetical protein [Candidatus Paceibacterota bacterium]
MINLIPPVAKRAMLREYWQRVALVWLLCLCGCMVLAGLLTAPSFVLVQSQLQAYQSQVQSAAAMASEQDALAETITTTNEQAATVLAAGQVPSMTAYLEQVRALANQGITISRIEVVRADTSISEVVVSGVADTRVSLTTFANRIESSPQFSEASVPLENLAANEDIAFTLQIAVTPAS